MLFFDILFQLKIYLGRQNQILEARWPAFCASFTNITVFKLTNFNVNEKLQEDHIFEVKISKKTEN